jgi:hypothetical protein
MESVVTISAKSRISNELKKKKKKKKKRRRRRQKEGRSGKIYVMKATHT